MSEVVLASSLINVDNLAVVLAAQTSRSIQAVDIVLREIQDRIILSGVATPDEFREKLKTKEVHDYLLGRADRLPQINNLVLIDALGDRTNDSLVWPPASVNLADRDY